MNALTRLRSQNDRIALRAMGRHGTRPRTYDVQVRADAAAHDLFRLPVTLDSITLLQDENGDDHFLAGETPLDSSGVF